MTDSLSPHRSTCSIARALDLFGDKWTLLVLRDVLWNDKHTFQALQSCAERIPSNLLAQRLKRLETQGFLIRDAYQDRPKRYRYLPTDKARTLDPILREMMLWGHEHLNGTFVDRDGQDGPNPTQLSLDLSPR
jgi:DNA-binding HxlR family transcriptional regulator